MDKKLESILNKLPLFLKDEILSLNSDIIESIEEIRLNAKNNTIIVSSGKETVLSDADKMNSKVLEGVLNRLLNYSFYAYEEELPKGYITIAGGHRVGICGKAVMEDGRVKLIRDISSLNIRRSKAFIGTSDKILNAVFNEKKNQINNTLIISPPKCGKTTMLRDLARSLSDKGYRLSICDERSEIAGSYDGLPSYEIGERTDVLDGCPKALGIIMLIRAMSPDIIITDEIGKAEDVVAIKEALTSGVKIITSIHGSNYEEIINSPIKELIQDNYFDTLIFLSATPTTGTVKKIMKLGGMKEGV